MLKYNGDDLFQLLFMNREPDDEVCYNSRDDDDDVDTFFQVGLDLLHLNLIDLLCNHYW